MPKLTRRQALLAAPAAASVAAFPLSAQQSMLSPWGRTMRRVEVNGIEMAYAEMGDGSPIVFLHGNPTSSYLWRNIMPHVQHLGRCIAPDLVGMGDSGPFEETGPNVYTFVRQRDQMFATLDALGIEQDVILVLHDWGSAIGFSWAEANPERVKGIAYMESIVSPPKMAEENEAGGFFARLRSPAGEQLVLEDNLFVERLFIGGLSLYLTDEDKAEYRRRYLVPGESRRPTLTWPRELPLGGKPEHNAELIRSYSQWLEASPIPKLFVRAEPGAIFGRPAMLEYARSFPNQEEVMVYGGHFVQEVSPDAIGRAIADWAVSLG